MDRFMRILVFFDLPVKSKKNRKEATRFRNFLLKDGYFMLQYSVYVRICKGIDSVEKHRLRIKQNIPAEGAIRVLTITEKIYGTIDIFVGRPNNSDEPYEQLTIL